ncbi:Calbindin-32 [Hypsibius exemplaris]|uniref:Calbindin-32 n=1 Tax=Hypsibius exemplaris TaxID=2072580 RepID=A0A1W0WKL9_HYPEX|nr:Calbindin-32 [Hypsibius exemplaris]
MVFGKSAKKVQETDGQRKGQKSRNFIEDTLKASGNSGSLRPVTADHFLEIWKYYDKDGNGFLEREELDRFLNDFLNSSIVGMGSHVSESEVAALKQTFLEEFDENKDGKISIGELTGILPVDESFFVLFRLDGGADNGIDYMKIWKKYDRDLSGFIEKNELKQFLHDLIKNQKSGAGRDVHVTDKRLNEYTKTIMDLFDVNGDGKLGLSELSRMLPASENFVQLVLDKALSLDKLSQKDVDQLIQKYDKDGNGTLEGTELANLVTDILELTQKDGFYNASDVYDLQQAILKGCDVDHDGRIDRRELAVILLAILNAGVEGVHDYAEDYNRRVYQGRKSQHILSYVPLPKN